MDGVLADFERAYHEVEQRLYGPAGTTTRAGDPEEEAAEEEAEESVDPDARPGAAEAASRGREPVDKAAPRHRELRRKRDVVWKTIQATPDFWAGLEPLEVGAVRRIHEMMLRHRWEVFFITQRPTTAGETVQRQTQHWLVAQGFDLPSVLVIPGSRGGAAGALRLDYHVDDSPKNCIDVKSESGAKPLLILQPPDETSMASARRLGIGTASSIGHALDILEEASATRAQPTLLHRLAKLVGWH